MLLRADGGGADAIRASHEERLIRMQGHDTFREAVRRLSESTLQAVDQAGVSLDDIDLFVYHQANARILAAVGERLGLDRARVIDCIDRYGNTSSATIPLARARERGLLEPGPRCSWRPSAPASPGGRGGPVGVNGSCALVTGASRGIGAAIARGLAEDGLPVAINYRADREGAERVAKQIEDAGGRAPPSSRSGTSRRGEGALRSCRGAARTRARAGEQRGHRADGLSPRLDDEDWDQVLATNLSAAFRTTRRALRRMLKEREGRIVNIASVVGGARANPGQANYAASKAGLVALTKTVAAEVARRSVTVNAVAPGFVETELTEGVGRELLEAVPARRPGSGGDRRVRALPGLGPGVVRHRRAVDDRRRSDRLKGERDVHHGHKDQVEERIGEALIEFGAEPDQINRDAEFERLDVDSLDLVELAQIAEDEWGVQIKGEDMEGIKTVGQAVDLVTGRMS